MAKKKVIKSVDHLDIEKQIIQLELEKSRLSREKGMIILNKSTYLYFTFMFIGVIGFLNHYLSSAMLNFIIVMGLIALVVGTLPYIFAAHKEQKNLTTILNNLLLKMGTKDEDFKKRVLK